MVATSTDRIRYRSLRELTRQAERHYLDGLEAIARETAADVERALARVAKSEDTLDVLTTPLLQRARERVQALIAETAALFVGFKPEGSGRPWFDQALAIGRALPLILNRKRRHRMGLKQALALAASSALPLTEVEEARIEAARNATFDRIKGLGNRLAQDMETVLIEADSELRATMEAEIDAGLTAALAARKTTRELEVDLRKRTGDSSRDWLRIAATELQSVSNVGQLATIKKHHGDEAIVIKIPRPNACKWCKALHLDPDGHPRKFLADELEEGGYDNSGRRRNAWVPTMGATHPFCACEIVRLPPGWDTELVDGEIDIVSALDKSLTILRRGDDLRKGAVLAQTPTASVGLSLVGPRAVPVIWAAGDGRVAGRRVSDGVAWSMLAKAGWIQIPSEWANRIFVLPPAPDRKLTGMEVFPGMPTGSTAIAAEKRADVLAVVREAAARLPRRRKDIQEEREALLDVVHWSQPHQSVKFTDEQKQQILGPEPIAERDRTTLGKLPLAVIPDDLARV